MKLGATAMKLVAIISISSATLTKAQDTTEQPGVQAPPQPQGQGPGVQAPPEPTGQPAQAPEPPEDNNTNNDGFHRHTIHLMVGKMLLPDRQVFVNVACGKGIVKEALVDQGVDVNKAFDIDVDRNSKDVPTVKVDEPGLARAFEKEVKSDEVELDIESLREDWSGFSHFSHIEIVKALMFKHHVKALLFNLKGYLVSLFVLKHAAGLPQFLHPAPLKKAHLPLPTIPV